MTFAATYEDPPRVWGVGRVVVGDEIVPWPVSEADIDDETKVAATVLHELGLRADELVLIVSYLSQAIHVAPFERAAGVVGALYSSADASRFDAFRTASLVRQLHPTVVIGVDDAVLDGFDDLGRDPADVFASVRAVVASGTAAQARLTAAGATAGVWLRLGALSAVACPGETELRYDPTRWQVDQADGELLVTNLADRLTPSDRFRTGFRGRVPTPGRIAL
ncbi:MAG: hypothetical protein MUP97_18525 [Acidimicrobiia bacterium]|nr:hypothetical protein [Acidimicrobiia bacterium]